MKIASRITILGGLVLGVIGVIGCHEDKPHEYGLERPPVDRIDYRDKGLQSKDVVSASDKMAMDLLSTKELNQSGHRWTVVVDRVENLTASRRDDLDIFIRRTAQNVNRNGRDRVLLVENRDKFYDMRNRELDGAGGGGDEFGQGGGGGGGGAAPGRGRIQPDYFLYGRISEMPNRGTSYFFCEFTLTNSRTGEQIWTNAYEVKVNN